MLEKLSPVVEGDGLRIRLAGLDDARFLFDLRTDPKLTRYIPPLSDFASHYAWLEKNLPRADDYLFIAEELNPEAAKGIISIHDISFADRSGYIGRWIMKPESGCAFEAIRLAYVFAFEMLKLERIWTETLVKNQPVVSFHLGVGLKKERVLPEPWILRGEPYEVQRMYLDSQDWPETNEKIKKFHRFISRSKEEISHDG